MSVSVGDEKRLGIYDSDKKAFIKCQDEALEFHSALVHSPDEKPTNMYRNVSTK